MAALTGTSFVQHQHPAYTEWAPTWRKLANAYEGTGGFADGTYLVPHPREWEDFKAQNPVKPTKKLLERRRLARYENWARRIVKTFADSLFRQMPTRQVCGESDGDTPIETWWENVDGHGTHIDDFWPMAWRAAGTFGHVFILVDRSPDEALTAADAGAPFLRVYTPLDAPDWLDQHGHLQAIKFIEAAPRASLSDPYVSSDIRTRFVTESEWVLYDHSGSVLSRGDHGMGMLPVVTLYADRRTLTQVAGASTLGDPQLFVDHYNLISEHRELLRKQTFGILNIPLGPDGDVERAKALLGDSVSTDNVLFSALPAQFVSPLAENTAAYRAERTDLLRAIFRLAGLQWEADSRDAEASGSLKLKREDMSTALSGYADNLEQADYAVSKLWYRATHGSIDAGDRAYESDEIQIRYPDTFEATPFQQLLNEAQAAMALGMGPEFKKEMRKRLVEKFLPDLPASKLKDICDEIDEQADDAPAPELMRQALVARVQQAGMPTIGHAKAQADPKAGKPAQAKSGPPEQDDDEAVTA
jgi:hypothetical protein